MLGRVDHYELIRLLGEGSSSRVWLARDVELGRLVALKVLEAGYAARFSADELKAEARALAQLDHPGIARVWSHGTHEGRPYFALEYVEGQNLRELLKLRTFDPVSALKLVTALAEAVAAAHAAGLRHGDLKPENVLLGRGGAPRLVDLGLARPAGAVARGIEGTLAYLPPEAAPGTAADVWALGVIWFECLTRSRPYPQTAAQLPPGFAEGAWLRALDPLLAGTLAGAKGLLTRMLSIEPSARPGAAELVELLRPLSPLHAAAAPGERPFRGLEPYLREHAHLFFGREAELQALRHRLHSTRLVAVVGPSGVGKSSLLMAGLAPLFEEEGALPSIVVRPGRDPFLSVARVVASSASVSLAEAGEPTGDDALAARLKEQLPLLGRLLRERAEGRGRRLLLLLDQAEELFTLTPESERVRFVQALLLAADAVEGPVRVALSLRDDFLGRVAELAELAAAVERGMFLLRAPSPQALREVVTRSLEPFGYRFEDASLPDEMVAEVKGQSASLPLLQFAAARLWDARDEQRRVLPRGAYEAMGGVSGALADQAQATLEAMPEKLAQEARALLLRMLTPEGTRVPVPVKELGPGAAEALERLVAARLLQRRREDDRDVVELAHESLAQTWGTLRRWRAETREDAELERFLATAAQRWAGSGKRAVDRLRGVSLDEAIAFRRRHPGRPMAQLDELLAASTEGEERRRAFRRRLRAGIVAALSVIAVGSVAAAGLIARQASIARASEQRATEALAVSLTEAAAAALEREDPVEARARLRASLEIQDSVTARALWQRLEAGPLRHRLQRDEMFYAVAFAPGGDVLATGGSAGPIRLVELATGRELSLAGEGFGSVLSLLFLDGGATLLSSHLDGRLVEWELAAKKATVLHEVEHIAAWRIAATDGGKTIALTYADGSVWLIDRAARTPAQLLGKHQGTASGGAAFLPDGTLVTAGADGVRRWKNGAALDHRPSDVAVTSLALSRDGRRVALGHVSGRIELWEPESGATTPLVGHARQVKTLAFDATGRWLASGGWDGQRLWDLERHDAFALPGHADALYGLAFDPSGKLLASASIDRSVRVVSLEAAAALQSTHHSDRVHGVAFSSDGQLVASASADHQIRVWHVPSGVSRVLAASSSSIASVNFEPDSWRVLISGQDGTRQRIDVETGELSPAGKSSAQHKSFTIGPDGRRAGVTDGALQILSAGGEVLQTVDTSHRDFQSLSFSSDGARLASGEADGSVRVWDLKRGGSKLLGAHKSSAHAVAFQPGTSWIASGGGDRTVRLFDADGPGRWELPADADSVWVVRFTADGALLGAIGDNASVTLYDATALDKGAPPVVRRLGEGHGANEVDFSRTGLAVASTDEDSVRVWKLDGTPVWRAPALLSGCIAWPKLERSDLESARRAGLSRELERRPPSCAAKGELAACLAEAEGKTSWDGRRVAIACGGGIEVFEGDSRLLRADTAPHFAITARGLLTLRGGTLSLSDAWAVPGVTAASRDGAAVIDGRLLELDLESGRTGAELARPGNKVVALARHGTGWALGFSTGEVRVVRKGAREVSRTFTSAPATVLASSGGLLAIGHANGAAEVWMPDADRVVWSDRLHGGVSAIDADPSAVRVVSELGDWRRFATDVFQRDACGFLGEVWQKAPARWAEGGVALAPPPPGHRCVR